MADPDRPKLARALAAAAAVGLLATLVLARTGPPGESTVAAGPSSWLEEEDALDDDFDFGTGSIGRADGAEPEVATHAS